MHETKALISRWRGNLGVVLERRPQCAVSHEVRRRGLPLFSAFVVSGAMWLPLVNGIWRSYELSIHSSLIEEFYRNEEKKRASTFKVQLSSSCKENKFSWKVIWTYSVKPVKFGGFGSLCAMKHRCVLSWLIRKLVFIYCPPHHPPTYGFDSFYGQF